MSEVLSSAYLEEAGAEVCKYPLSDDRVCHIGRGENSTIVLDDERASRNHVILQRSDSGAFYLTDLGSTNGTLVNGVRVSAPVVLRHGDRIQIGDHELTFHQESVSLPEPEGVPQKATTVAIALKTITVVVVDIRDFTVLAQRVGSDKLGEVAGTLFRQGGEVLRERGAWAQKYIGDAVMAIWVHTSKRPKVEEFIGVFDALSRLHAIAAQLHLQFGLDAPIRIGAGVNTGEASTGNFGSIAASDYTALGDVVNKAFRLESATKQAGCDLLLGSDTYEFLSRVPDAVPLFHSCVVNLKGYAEPATAHAAQLTSIPALLGALQKSRAILGTPTIPFGPKRQ